MTIHEAQAVDDAMWYLRHGAVGAALNILRRLRHEPERMSSPSEPVSDDRR